MQLRYEGTVVLVTGSGHGLGRSLALGFARAGADVVVNYAHSEQAARETADEIAALGRRAAVMRADVTRPDEVDAMLRGTMEQLGKVDVLVNNAAVNRDGAAWKLSEEDWDVVLDNSLKSVFVCTKAVLPQMRERSYGRIVNISSAGAHLGIYGTGAYAAAKAGIAGFSRCVAREVAAKGITINTLLPGYIQAGMYHRLTPEFIERAVQRVPMGRFARDEEVVDAALFLGSRQASYITGVELNVTGGLGLVQ